MPTSSTLGWTVVGREGAMTTEVPPGASDAPAEHRQAQLIRASGIPVSISTPVATLMGLSPVPTKQAPDCTLADQNGHLLSLEKIAEATDAIARLVRS
jgi:arginase family enzyme